MAEELLGSSVPPWASPQTPMPENRDSCEQTPASDPPPRRQYRFVWIVILLLIGSLCVRLYNINSPLLEVHHYRQTHTAMNVYYFLQDGIDLLHPQTPILGPPWVLAYEFPLYQASAALLVKATGLPLDPACRITNIIYFYLSAGLLFLLSRFVLKSTSTAIWVLLFYVWFPFTIVWSRTCMIEFTAVTFVLAYVYFTLLWLRRQHQIGWLILAILAGCLGALAKITTIAVVAPIMVIMPLAILWEDLQTHGGICRNGLYKLLSSRWLTVAGLVVLALVPLLVYLPWLHHTEKIKSSSPGTLYLSLSNSGSLAWEFGTLEQRFTLEWYRLICERIGALAVPFAVLALPATALMASGAYPRFPRIFIYSVALSVIFPILLFFNLYHEHDYYMCAVMPYVALLTGFGFEHIRQKLLRFSWPASVIAGLFILFSFFSASGYLVPSFTNSYNNVICQVGKAIEELTPPDEHVVVLDWDISPSILYYTKRRGWLQHAINPNFPDDPLVNPPPSSLPFLRSGKFTTIVCMRTHPEVFSLWTTLKEVRQVGPFHILKVSDPVKP
jgi:4-amino-4-deoxy-L-arabinose transferase-like glycosyltransferase